MRTKHSHSKVQKYIESTFVEEDEILRQTYEKGETLQKGMQISPSEGKLLYMLVKIAGVKSILEIGTFVGYSTIWMARALPEDGKIISLERRKEHSTVADKFIKKAKLDNKVEIVTGDALTIIKEMKHSFDMVFIDASKQEYMSYLQAVEPLLNPNALVIGDNSLLFGTMTGDEPKDIKVSRSAKLAVSEFNRRIGGKDASGLYEGIMIPTEEGLTIGRWIGGE